MSAGGFFRRIEIATRQGGARATVEDDFHHFRIELEHCGGAVTRVTSQALRYPWTACPAAADRLTEIIGMPLSPAATAVRLRTEQRLQCTHMFDLTGLAIAASARGLLRRRYDVIVPDRISGRTRASLARDCRSVLAWNVDGDFIAGPPPFCGVSLRAGFWEWATHTLDLEQAEAAIVLRRGVFVSGGRGKNLDSVPTAPAKGGCITQQPHRAPFARRVIGSTRDFTLRRGELAIADQEWLNFADQ